MMFGASKMIKTNVLGITSKNVLGIRLLISQNTKKWNTSVSIEEAMVTFRCKKKKDATRKQTPTGVKRPPELILSKRRSV